MRPLLLSGCLLLALAAQAQTWTYKSSWGTAELTMKPDGTCPTTYHNGNGTHQCTYTIVRVAGTMVYLKGATEYGFTADGWMTPTHHQFTYTGREGGTIDLEGTNTVPQSMLDAFAALPFAPAAMPKDVVPGLKVDYYTSRSPGYMNSSVVMDKIPPDATGSADTFSVANFSGEFEYGLIYTGYIDLPKDDLYHFSTTSRDGSVLYIDKVMVVSNDNGHDTREEPGAMKLAAGLHAVTLYYTHLVGVPVLSVSYAAGDAGQAVVPASMLFRDKGDLKPLTVTTPIFTPTPAGPHGWLASACSNPYEAKNVLDGKGVRWSTIRAMQPGDWLQIDLTKGYKLKSVTLDSSRQPGDAAHGVQLLLSQDGATFAKVAEKTADECAALNGLVKFDLPAGAAARYVKFVQTGTAGVSWWSVNSVDVEVIE